MYGIDRLGAVSSYKIENPGYIEFTNGLIINFGNNTNFSNNIKVNIAKPFKKLFLGVACTPLNTDWTQPAYCIPINLTQVHIGGYGLRSGAIGWIVIGH